MLLGFNFDPANYLVVSSSSHAWSSQNSKSLYEVAFLLIFISPLGAIFILRKDIGVGGPENGNFSLLYVVKMSLRRWVGGSKKPQNTLT